MTASRSSEGGKMPSGFVEKLAHHDAAINQLGTRMGGVESRLGSLQGEVHTGFSKLTKLIGDQTSKLDARPAFDLHKVAVTLVALSALFASVVTGIIWITSNQFGVVVAKQEGFNEAMKGRVTKLETNVEKINDTIGVWKTRIVNGGAR